MSVCITGEARNLITGINLVPNNILWREVDDKLVLQEIKALLIPSSDSDMTRAQLSSAK